LEVTGFFGMIFRGFVGRNPMWISWLWYGFGAFLGESRPNSYMKTTKSVLMRKTIVFNVLLILGYYLVLQLLVWLAMIFR
jgi:hypothetical protein